MPSAGALTKRGFTPCEDTPKEGICIATFAANLIQKVWNRQ